LIQTNSTYYLQWCGYRHQASLGLLNPFHALTCGSVLNGLLLDQDCRMNGISRKPPYQSWTTGKEKISKHSFLYKNVYLEELNFHWIVNACHNDKILSHSTCLCAGPKISLSDWFICALENSNGGSEGLQMYNLYHSKHNYWEEQELFPLRFR
jgi:hypothetical protein